MKKLSIFDSFVYTDNINAAISLVYAQGNYFLFYEQAVSNICSSKKKIGLMFYNDSLVEIPEFFKDCHFSNSGISKLKFGVFENENSETQVRKWIKSVIAISTTWQVSVSQLKQWCHDSLASCRQEVDNHESSYSLGLVMFAKSGKSRSISYQWAKYKLSQLGISCYMLHT